MNVKERIKSVCNALVRTGYDWSTLTPSDICIRYQTEYGNMLSQSTAKTTLWRLRKQDWAPDGAEVKEVGVEAVEPVVTPETPKTGAAVPNEALGALETLMQALSSKIDPEQIRAMVKAEVDKAKSAFRGVEVKIPDREAWRSGDGEVVHEVFDSVLALAACRIPVFLSGPTGCGKSHMVGQVASAMGLSFSSISCSAGMSESQLAGWLLPLKDGGAFDYVPTPFVKAYTEGGVFLLDEIDSADANTLTFINSAIANGHMYVPQAGVSAKYPGGRLDKSENFVLVAAANTWGTGPDAMFVGRNQLDAATLDRFAAGMVHMDYSEAIESRRVASDVLKWGRKIRAALDKLGVRRTVSTRTLQHFSVFKEANDSSLDKLWGMLTAAWSSDEKSRVMSEAKL